MESSKPQEQKKHFAAVIRHGERGDRVENFPCPNPCDPPLTPHGLKQAKATGDFLKEFFASKNYQFDKVIIECSPFLRCMMTAGQVASALGIKEIIINYRTAEFLQEQKLTDIVSRYSQFVSVPIFLETQKTVSKDVLIEEEEGEEKQVQHSKRGLSRPSA